MFRRSFLTSLAAIASHCALFGQTPTANPRPEQPLPQSEAKAGLAKLQEVTEQSEKLIFEGKRSEANTLILSVFPEPGRTPLEGFLLGNVLYAQDPELSYKFHKAAAAAFPQSSQVMLEWALEQHRAGEWEGALAAYKTFSEFKPEQAPPYGLAAECALRLGRTAEAVELWLKSEAAPRGKLEDLETLICAVHGPRPADDRREELLALCRKGDQSAAVSLIALDLEWPRDWWNGGPMVKYLELDLATIASMAKEGGRELGFAILAGKLFGQKLDDGEARRLFKDSGFLADNSGVPANGRILSSLLSYLHEHQLTEKAVLRDQLRPILESMARLSTDPEFHNARAWLFLDTGEMEAIDRMAWQHTNDARFAASLLVELLKAGRLKSDSPELIRALKQFPENSIIASMQVKLMGEKDAGREQAVVRWILAQYSKLEPGGLLGRPSARSLQAAFSILRDLLHEKSRSGI